MATKAKPSKPSAKAKQRKSRLLPALLWTIVLLLFLAGIDQLLVRIPAKTPAHVAAAGFYRDLRGRVVALAKGMQGSSVTSPASPVKTLPPAKGKEMPPGSATIEGVLGQHQAQSSPDSGSPMAKASTPRYLYADKYGELHFAGTLAEVPDEYRGEAKVLGK